MPREKLSTDVLSEAIERMRSVYRAGHRVVVSFSGGKDSGVVLEVCIIAARAEGKLPVEVAMRDEEAMYPGTFEYCERVAARPEVKFDWYVCHNPIINVFNRQIPYYWAFDQTLPPEKWMRTPPPFAKTISDASLHLMIIPERYEWPDEDHDLVVVTGVRASESTNRLMGIFSSKGFLTKSDDAGIRYARPIYDFQDGDIWKAIRDNKWDYNKVYDIFAQFGVPRHLMRVATPALRPDTLLSIAAKAWPSWFAKLCERLPGVRLGAQYGIKAVRPIRAEGESWKATFARECVERAPEWIKARAEKAAAVILENHARHSTSPFPDDGKCGGCAGSKIASWKMLANSTYDGDPQSFACKFLPRVEPSFFRAGAAGWDGVADVPSAAEEVA